ncbi:hypothetical protein MMC30_004693 [Trapelia coarctata]|nr:hypothetical protein [Trapelia coarctata]
MSTAMSPTRRPLSDDEKAPPPKVTSKNSSFRLWEPSKGIEFAPSTQTTTWNPTHGIVFSKSKPGLPADFQEKRYLSGTIGFTPSVRKSSPPRKASSAQFQSCRTSESAAKFLSTTSSPLPSSSVRYVTVDREEPLQEAGHRSTVMTTATPSTPSTLAVSTGGSCQYQRATASSAEHQRIEDLGNWSSTKKEHEYCGVREFRSENNQLLHLRSAPDERQTAHRSCVLDAKASRFEQPRQRYKGDGVRQYLLQKMISQYTEVKDLFRPSSEAWSALQPSQAEAYLWVSSERAKARVAFIGREIWSLRDDFDIWAHQFREIRMLRSFLDGYSSMSPEQQYLSLRRVRINMLYDPFITCTRGYNLVIDQLLSYLKILELNGKSVPDHFKTSVLEEYNAQRDQLSLSIVERYNLYHLVSNPQVNEQVHYAAVLAAKVRHTAAAVVFSLKRLRVTVTSTQGYDNSGRAFRYKAKLFELLGKRAMDISVQLKLISRLYEEIIIRCTGNHARRAKRQTPGDTGVVRIIPKSAYPLRLSSPALDTTKIAYPLQSPIDTGAAVGNSDHPTYERPDKATDPNRAHKTEDNSRSTEIHTIGEHTKGRVSLLEFTPSNPLHYAGSTHNSQSQADVMDDELEHTEPGSECEDQVADKHVIDSLLYQIPEAKLKEAMLSSRSTMAAYWRYSLYEHPTRGKVKVHYCKSKETTERTAQLFLGKGVVGFDIEWKPQAQMTDGLKKNVSLIQLASEERIALFHIARYPKGETIDDFLAPTLKCIMEDPNISKVGVSVKSDCTRLRKFMGIESRGLFELSHLYKLIKLSPGSVKKIDKRLVSLAQQVEEHLQLPLWKGDVRSSDWSTNLNYQQMQYAASDSYAGLQLYNTMESKRKALDPTPPRPHHAELNLPIRLASGQTVETFDEAEATAEKSASEEAEDTSEKPVDDAPLPAPSIEEMAREFMDIAIEDSDAPKASAAPTKRPEVVSADAWVAEYRNSRPADSKSKSTPAFLRAYSLWHHQEVEVMDATKLLRDPPLQVSTVCCYILEAVRIEKLPFVVERLREVLKQVEGTSGGRYQGLKKLVE